MNKIALFSQSLFALPLDEAITAAAETGYRAIELACGAPHFELDTAQKRAEEVQATVAGAGLQVSALSLFSNFTEAEGRDAQLAAAETYIELAPLFETGVVKLNPGTPVSAVATQTHWDRLEDALERLAPLAEENGCVLAVETHLRQVTDTLEGSLRLLDIAPSETVGLTVDFSNLRFMGDDPAAAVDALWPRIYNVHVKNGYIDESGGWHFLPLNEGLTDYSAVLSRLAARGYDGYLTVECLQPEAAIHPRETARRDLGLLRALLGGN